ncbi:MAG: SpoIID/LytB domain-containing protein [Candidatus Shapirobacteria bacterium]
MRRMFKFLILLFLVIFLPFVFPVLGKECNEGDPQLDSLCRQEEKVREELSLLTQAISGAEKSLSELNAQITGIRASINQAQKEVKTMEEEITNGQKEIESQKKLLFAKIRDLYIQETKLSALNIFLASQNFGQALKQYNYLKVAGQQDKKIITGISNKITSLNQSKQSLEGKSQSWLSLEEDLDTKAAGLEKDIKGATAYEGELNDKIAAIKAEQQRILTEKTGLFQTSVGDTPSVDDPCSGPPGAGNFCSPAFSPAFALFSFGAPHRTGMSQYGAYGRSKEGQSAEDILSAYYQGANLVKDYSVPDTIGVDGYGRIAFEDNYLLGIYEVPESWGDKGGFEALKAQAVASRSYALAVTGNGNGTICPTESCQVYRSALKTGKWEEAVRATRGWVLMKDGSPAKAYYASTSGGFTISQWGWAGIKDAKDGDWPNNAYEKIAGSPWFYKAWYKTRSGQSCGRSSPWLSDEEMADVVNALLVYTHNSSESIHLSQVDGCWGSVPETWSKEELAGRAGSYGGPVSRVSNVSVNYSNSGVTHEVKIATDRGEFTFSGSDFKTVFNLRAPGAIHLKSSLFNLVKI